MLTDLSPVMIAALATAGCALIGAFFAGIVSVITAWRTIVTKVTSIDAHVNSEKTALQEQAAAKDKEIALLREILTDHKTQAALLAQAQATRTRIATEAVALGTPAKPVPVEVVNQPLATKTTEMP